MTQHQDILDFFDYAHIVEASNGQFVVNIDDMIIRFHMRDIEIMNCDEYLDDIRTSAHSYVARLDEIASKLNEIKESSSKAVLEEVTHRLNLMRYSSNKLVQKE